MVIRRCNQRLTLNLDVIRVYFSNRGLISKNLISFFWSIWLNWRPQEFSSNIIFMVFIKYPTKLDITGNFIWSKLCEIIILINYFVLFANFRMFLLVNLVIWKYIRPKCTHTGSLIKPTFEAYFELCVCFIKHCWYHVC